MYRKVTQQAQAGINLPQWMQPSEVRSESCLFCICLNQLLLATVPGYLLCQSVISLAIQLVRVCRKAVVSLHLVSVYVYK